MDEDEIANAVAAQMPQQAPQGGTSYDGRVAVNPATGERVVWRISPGGRGRFVALSADTADAPSRERVTNLQTQVNVGRNTLPQAQRFMERNFAIPTGGLQNSLSGSLRAIASVPFGQQIADADQLNALSSQMVGSNWQPGTTGMMNTPSEMEQIRRRYPSPNNLGRANADVYGNLYEDMVAQREALADMRQWLSQHTNLNEWDAQWSQREPEVRQRARREAQQWLLQQQRERRGGGASGREIHVDANGNRIVR